MDTMDAPMYSREMGGIRSDGQLYELQRRMQQETASPIQEQPRQEQQWEPPPPQEQVHEEPVQETMASYAPPQKEPPGRGGLFNLSFLHDLKMDDLLLLAIGFLLLTDSGQERNDLLFLLIGLLLLF